MLRTTGAIGNDDVHKIGGSPTDSVGEPNNQNAWARLPQRLAEVGQRLKRVQVENLAFEDCLRRYDSRDTLFLLHPPWLPETMPRRIPPTPQKRSVKVYTFPAEDGCPLLPGVELRRSACASSWEVLGRTWTRIGPAARPCRILS